MPARTPSARKSAAPAPEKDKSLESWIWDAACSIRGAKDAPKYSRAERDTSRDSVTRRERAEASVNNFIPEAGIQRIAGVLIGWKEEETAWRESARSKSEGKSQVQSKARKKLSHIVDRAA